LLIPNFLLGLLLSSIISTIAYFRGSLSPGGVVGAIIVGTTIFAVGGLAWAILLVAFFLTSSILSHYKSTVKEPLAEKFQKGHRRDLGQVLANGGWGALLAVGSCISPGPVLFFAFIGAMATVTADTWATELGVLSSQPPRLITNGRTVTAGTSGALTLFGTAMAVCGSAFIGLLASLDSIWSGLTNTTLGLPFMDLPTYLRALPSALTTFVPIAIVSGLAGSLFDSFLGATAQAIYFCDFDLKETEAAVHRCGRSARLIRGWRWLDNDWVNFLSSIFGSAIGMIGYWVMS
jgi:uncharacterized protein (TIGR00297 family)